MRNIIKYIGAGVITFLAFILVEKFMPNLEITEELTLFMFASVYLNIINLVNNSLLKAKVNVNQFMNTRLQVALHGEERCRKAADALHKEYLKAMEEK